MKCSKCGIDQDPNTRFCGACGAPMGDAVLPRAAVRPIGRTVFQGAGKPGPGAAPGGSTAPSSGGAPLAATIPAPAPAITKREVAMAATLVAEQVPPEVAAAAASMAAKAARAQPVATSPVVAKPVATPPVAAKPVATPPLAAKPVATPPVAARPAPAPAAAAASPAPPAAAAKGGPISADEEAAGYGDLVGCTLNNRFLVQDRLGEGGFGTVYRAEQILIGRPCALKVLHPKMARDENVVGRFKREAQAAAALKNQHTVQTYDFDQTADGMLYLAMELLGGRSLHNDMAHGPMSPTRVLHILDGVADSLGEAHSNGIVHRDIKPENVHLETVGADHDFAKVLDFGIAKIVSGEGSKGPGQARAPALTAAGQTLGTLEYMSPEQLMGQQLDGRSDLYALGILAYEMLTGDLPFKVKNAGEMISAHLRTVPQPPSKSEPEANIPPQVDALVLKLLEKDRNRRPRDAAELQQELRRVSSELSGPLAIAPSTESATRPVAAAPVAPAAAPAVAMAPRGATTESLELGSLPLDAASRPARGSGSRPLIIAIALLVLAVLAGAFVLLRNAGAAEPPPPAVRLLPATLNAFVAIDLAALRAASPAESVAAIDRALASRAAELGVDPARIARLAAGIDTAAVNRDKPPAVVIIDAPLDRAKVEALLKQQMKSGERFAPASYKGQKYRKSPSLEIAQLAGGRTIVTGPGGLRPVFDLGRPGSGPLVDGEAATLLGRLGAAGGRGPAVIAWMKVTDAIRRDVVRGKSDLPLREVAAALSLRDTGPELQVVADCTNEAGATQAADVVRKLLEQARRDRTVAMLGLAPIVAAFTVTTDGGVATLGLRLTTAQYADLFTRMAGIAAASVEQFAPPPAPAPATGKRRAK